MCGFQGLKNNQIIKYILIYLFFFNLGIKEDIYGRLVNKKGAIVQSEKYVPPAQRLQQLLEKSEPESNLKLARLNKQLNGLFNRLSTANIQAIDTNGKIMNKKISRICK